MYLIRHKEFIRNNYIPFAKFLLVGCVNTLIGYLIFVVFSMLGIGANPALLLTYCVAVPINYMTTGRFVFSTTTLKKLIPFIISYFVIYCCNLLLIKILISQNIPQIIAQALLLPVVALISYIIFKQIVFRKE